MKNYNKILEAVNRGIQLALDDFEDEEQVQNIKSKQVQNRDYTKEYLDLIRDTVNFNLPSGNLWYKFNLGAVNSTESATSPLDWYGDYYAWGELEPKDDYNIYNYKHSEIIHAPRSNVPYDELFTKYCHNPEDGYKGYSDNLIQLAPGDDAVHAKLGLNYFIPTESDFIELFNNTTQTLRKDYKDIKGLNGIELASKEDDQRMFLPFTGYRSPKGVLSYGIDGDGISLYLWISSFNGEKTNMATNIGARKYEFEAGWKIRWIEDKKRIFGLPLRPVYKQN